METLFDGIPLERGHDVDDDQRARRRSCWPSTSSPPRSRASPPRSLGGTIQNDILKEYIAQNEWFFPPEPSMRLVTDMIECCTRARAALEPDLDQRLPHPRGRLDRAQELAFTLADGFAYVERAIERGLDVDDFAPRLSFFFNAHNDFFEEIAKFRAARRIWAREMRERFGAKDRALAADALPHPDRRRVADRAAAATTTSSATAIQALAAVLGGTQSLHTNSLDEALALPTEEAVTIALRTQQIIAHETRRRQHDRSARRPLLRRGADRRDRGAAPTTTSRASTSSAAWSRRSSRASRSARSPTPPTATSSEVDAKRADHRRRQRLRGARTRTSRDPADRSASSSAAEKEITVEARSRDANAGGCVRVDHHLEARRPRDGT